MYETYLPYIILGLVALAMLHLVYEYIVLPSIRLKLRYKIFGLRDELRLLKIDKVYDVTDEEFRFLQESLNIAANILSQYDLYSAYQAMKALSGQHDLLKRIDRRNEIINSCTNSKYRAIVNRRGFYIGLAFCANSLFLLIWMLPIVIGYVILQRFGRKWNQLIITLVHIPERESDRLDSVCLC